LGEAADLERPHDVGDGLHQRPDAREYEQRVGALDEEVAAGPEGQHDHQDAADQAD
jgi:hypothetical protein